MALALISLVSCNKENEPFQPSLVVEGWIEEGEAPIVKLGRTIQASGKPQNIKDVIEAIQRYAKVSIKDEDSMEEYVLTSRLSDLYGNYFTTGRLIGQCGHTYTLKVEWQGKEYMASSTMPSSPTLARLNAWHEEKRDSVYHINATIWPDADGSESWYKFQYRTRGKDREYKQAFLSNIYSDGTREEIIVSLHNSFAFESGLLMKPLLVGDTVDVKLLSMQREVYNFWQQYDHNAAYSQMVIYSRYDNCKGNIEGAKGYWAAYSKDEKTVICEE